MMPCPPPEYVVYYALGKEYHSKVYKETMIKFRKESELSYAVFR